jgi:hypothetical protein
LKSETGVEYGLAGQGSLSASNSLALVYQGALNDPAARQRRQAVRAASFQTPTTRMGKRQGLCRYERHNGRRVLVGKRNKHSFEQ